MVKDLLPVGHTKPNDNSYPEITELGRYFKGKTVIFQKKIKQYFYILP